jgi:hypothetical protein
VSSKEDTFSKERGHESREKKFGEFWAKIFFLLWEAVLYESVQPYRFGTKIEAFRAQFSRRIS